jgi:hypothetical protein
MELTPIDVRNASEIERAIVGFSHEPSGGLIVLSSFLAEINRRAIITCSRLGTGCRLFILTACTSATAAWYLMDLM